MRVNENADIAKIASICLPLWSYGLLRDTPRPTHAEKGAAAVDQYSSGSDVKSLKYGRSIVSGRVRTPQKLSASILG